MPTADKGNPDLYKNLIQKGVSHKEIERVYETLRDRGYGDDEARRRSRAIISRVKASRDLEERRKAQKKAAAAASEPALEVPSAAETQQPVDGAAQEPMRRAIDWLPPLPLRLRRRINRWAFKNGFRIARLPERLNDLLSYFDKNRKDYASREFLEILGERKGFMAANPFEYSLMDTLEALHHASRRLLGADRPARRIADREKTRNLEEEVKRSLRVREPFALDFFGLFAEPRDMLMRSLEYVGASLKADARVEVPALARVVKESYRLILMTEGVEAEKLDVLFNVMKEVNLVHDQRGRALAELSEAQTQFLAAFQTLPFFKHELYPALLKMIAAFYEEADISPLKKARIFTFLELQSDMILTYAGYQKRLAEMREKALAEQKERELEQLEQEKREKFSYRFEGTLSTLSALFPESGIEKVEQGEFILPYFITRVFPKHPVFQRRVADVENFSAEDVMGFIVIVHMIVDDLLDSVDGYILEKHLGREGLGDLVTDLREAWKSVYDTLFEPYLDEIHELARETSGDPRYVKIFRESLRARSIEERANQLRNHAIRNYGHFLSERDLSDAPKLYELAERLGGLLSVIGESINPDLLAADDPLRRKLLDDLASTPIVDFAARCQASTPEYRPVTRQVRRYIEARYRQTDAENPPLAHVVFFDVFRGIADLYSYLLNDRKSFAAQTSHVMGIAGVDELRAWQKEKEDRSRESKLLLQERLNEVFPGQFEDGLTGLRNKNFFVSELPRRVEKLRAEGAPLTLLMVDIDHFKWVNDQLGHQDGDDVIKATAEMILENIREEDFAVRYGGEEILVALPADLHTGIILAERLRFTQEQNLLLKAAFIGIKLISEERKEPCGTLSIGVADATGITDLGKAVERADKALYAAKRRRNTVVFLDPEKPEDDPHTTYEDYRQKSKKE